MQQNKEDFLHTRYSINALIGLCILNILMLNTFVINNIDKCVNNNS